MTQTTPAASPDSALDTTIKRVLRVPEHRPEVTDEQVHQAFNRSIIVSAIRCTLTYVILPFVAPVVGLASGVGPVLGLVIGTVAIVSLIVSIRRFWLADHRWKWPFTLLSTGVLVLVTILVVLDVRELLT